MLNIFGKAALSAALAAAAALAATPAQARHRDHGDNDEQGFEPFTQQDRERAQERGRFGGGIRRERRFRIVEKAAQYCDLLREIIGRRAPVDRGAELPHRALDSTHQRRVARGECWLDRLEPIEIGRQRQLFRHARIAAPRSRHAFGEFGAGDRERAGSLLYHLFGMTTQEREHWVSLGVADRRAERGRGERDQGFQVRNAPAKGRVGFPKPLAFARLRIREGEAPGSEC